MENIKDVIKKTIGTKIEPSSCHQVSKSSTSSRCLPPKPEEKFCSECGNKIEFMLIDNPAYLKITGKEPYWMELPCQVCEEKRKRQEEQEKRIMRQEQMNALFNNNMLRKELVNKTLEGFVPYGKWKKKQQEVLSIAREFANNFPYHRENGTWLLFAGNFGTGKTHLCAGIIKEVIKQGYTAVLTKAPQLLRQVKRYIFNDNPAIDQEEIFNRLNEIDLLVIEEIGVQFGTLAERNILFEILDNRYEYMLPAIVTTNVTNSERLKQLIGESILDRFCERSSGSILFDWDSYRQRPSPKKPNNIVHFPDFKGRRGNVERGPISQPPKSHPPKLEI